MAINNGNKGAVGGGAVGGGAVGGGAVGGIGVAGVAGNPSDDSDSASSSSLLCSLSQVDSGSSVSSSSSDGEVVVGVDSIKSFERGVIRDARLRLREMFYGEGVRAVSLIRSEVTTKKEILSHENKSRMFDIFVSDVIASYSSRRSTLGSELLEDSSAMDDITTDLSQALFKMFSDKYNQFPASIDRYLKMPSSPLSKELLSLDDALSNLFKR